MNPSSPNHHRQTTRPVTGAGHYRHYVEAQTGWGIANFACAIRCYRILMIKADNRTRNSAGPLPDDLRHALIKIRADVRTNLSQVGSYATVKRRLRTYAQPGWRQSLAAACAAHAGLGPATLVLFDVSTLYFETDAGDGFREPGFSKERRLEPQITLGLLTDASGFPLTVAVLTWLTIRGSR